MSLQLMTLHAKFTVNESHATLVLRWDRWQSLVNFVQGTNHPKC